MTQKVLKVGDSAAVTIPKKSLQELRIKIGDEVVVTINKKNRSVFITPVSSIKVDQELLSWTDKFIKRYKPALDALAKK